MIEVGLHPQFDRNHAEVDRGRNVCWVTFSSGNGRFVIYGQPHQIDALKMMADIFNETFGDRPDPVPAPAFDATGLDIPYAPEPA
jgi:hypothetical protein